MVIFHYAALESGRQPPGYDPFMQVSINGEPRTIERPCTVLELLEQHGLGNAACAVEVNAALVPKAQQDQYTLVDGDSVEIVTLVGGG